jgi:hypothetical protein
MQAERGEERQDRTDEAQDANDCRSRASELSGNPTCAELYTGPSQEPVETVWWATEPGAWAGLPGHVGEIHRSNEVPNIFPSAR